MSAQVWAGVSEGLNRASQYIAEKPLREAQQREATARQQKAELELQEFQANAPMRKTARDLEMQQLQAQNYQTNAALTRQQTFDAFRMFESDKDARHLNTWLANVKSNPVGANMYGDVVRVDNIHKSSENDNMLRQMGYADPNEVYNDPELSKDLVVFTGTDKQGIVNMNDLYAGTGFVNYMTNEQLKIAETKARINQMMRQGTSRVKATAVEQIAQDILERGEAENLTEAFEKAYEIQKGETGMTNEERYVRKRMEEGITRADATAEYKNLDQTKTQKEIGDTQELRQGLDDMGWLDKNVSELSNAERGQVYSKYISPLEQFTGFKLGNEEKRVLRNMRDLTALGAQAGTELSEAETGLLDSTLNSFKKYMFNEIGGTVGTSAYETFRNVIRNALYGSALTDKEIAAFNTAAGKLGQKLTPVLSQLKTQMESVKRNLEAVRDLNDPYIAHYYTGSSIEDIDRAVEQLDDRLYELTAGKNLKVTVGGKKNQKPPVEAKVPDVSGTEKTKSLDDIFTENGLQ